MRVAVFRAVADGQRTAERLHALGHDPLLAPVLRIVPTGASVTAGQYDGVVFTSAHGVEAIDDAAAASCQRLPCFCVGHRTASCAEERGFRDVRSARADAAMLVALLCAAFPVSSRLLLIAGRDRKPIVEAGLLAAGHYVTVAEVYAAEAIAAWPAAAVAAFGDGHVDAALHFSQRSADLALAAATSAGLRDGFLSVSHHCLSTDAAAPLVAAGASRIVIAPSMDEAGLLATLRDQFKARADRSGRE